MAVPTCAAALIPALAPADDGKIGFCWELFFIKKY
jgi:hypothetical protein